MDSNMVTIRSVLQGRGMSNAQIKRAAASGKISISGVPTADTGRLVLPDNVQLRMNAPKLTPGRDLAVLFRDEHMAVVWKPAGWLSVKAANRRDEKDVVTYVAGLFGAGFAVHRLDEDTSGAMMVALTKPTQMGLKSLLEVHDVERRYLALVKGRPALDKWTSSSNFVRDRGDGLRGSGDGDDRLATTHFRVLDRFRGSVSLVEATLESGRTHQVRIHLAEEGHAVLGDSLYGDSGAAKHSPRLALHAAVLGFVHPITGQKKRFEVPLADDLEQLRREFQMTGKVVSKTVSGNRRPAKGKKQRK